MSDHPLPARSRAARWLPAGIAAAVAGWWLLDRARQPALTARTRERLRPRMGSPK
jgi:hypothetical protein